MPVRPCPRCKQPLEIPQPPPAKVQCPKCAAVLKLGAVQAGAVQAGAVQAGAVQASAVQASAVQASATVPNKPPPAAAPLPETDNPFDLADDPGELPVRRRQQSNAKGLIASLVLVLIIAGGVGAFFLLRGDKKEPDPAGPDMSAFVKLDDKPAFDPNAGRINEAIQKGVAYLKSQMMVRGDQRLYYRSELADVAPANAHLGATALAGLTLLECGISPDDPAVHWAAQIIRDAENNIHATYTLATAILFLDRLHANIPSTDGFRLNDKEKSTLAMKERDRALIRSFALRLITCQDQGGFWGYGRKVTKAEEEATLQRAMGGSFKGDKLAYKNLSNSQFAALALWAARRHGVPVRPSLEAVARAARVQQTKEGTWHYDLNLPMKHSSACAGLIFLALERGLAEEATTRSKSTGKSVDPKLNKSILEDPAVKSGIDYLGKFLAKPPTLSPKKKEQRQMTARSIKDYYEKYEIGGGVGLPSVSWTMDFAFGGTIFGADSWGDLYLLWSIERVGVIYDVKQLPPDKAGKDWYAFGSEIILNNQKEGGLWEDRFPGVPDTCFALLFLKRANIAKDLTDKIRQFMGLNTAQLPPGQQAPLPNKKE